MQLGLIPVKVGSPNAEAMGIEGARPYQDLGVSGLIVPLQALGGGNPLAAPDALASKTLSER